MSRTKSVFVPLAAPQIQKQSLREQAAMVIKRHIAEAKLQPGAALPTERDLSQGLAVSRTVIREALAVLEAEGLIERRPSAGYFVAPAATTLPPLALAQVQPLLHETLEARLAVEMGLAFLLAARVTNAELDELEQQALMLDEAMLRNEAHAEAELAFHLRLWAAAQNHSLMAVGRQILGDYFRVLALARSDSFYRPAQDGNAKRHLPLVNALRTRDAAQIQAAFREHCQLPDTL